MNEDFDPAAWRETQRKSLDEFRKAGQVDEQTYREALDEVEKRYREMLDRQGGDSPAGS